MAIELLIDPESLLAPFEGDHACGTDPRLDISPQSRFFRMKDARAEARRRERAIDVDGDAPSPNENWGEAIDAGCEILAQEGKDLEVGAWLVEGLVRLGGLSGFYTGLKIAQGLVDRFWEEAYPLPDEDGDEVRLAPYIALNGLNGDSALVQSLRKLPVTDGSEALTYWQYQQALELENVKDEEKRAAKIAAGAVTLEMFNLAVSQTPSTFYHELTKDIGEIRKALDDLSNAFSARVGSSAPPAGAIRNALEQIEDAVKAFAGDKLALAAASAEHHAEGDEGASEAPGAGVAVAGQSGKLTSREDAFQQILRIAAYFREKEPHSPISYTLEEIVRRGRMTLPELLEELITDEEARRFFFVASGAKPRE